MTGLSGEGYRVLGVTVDGPAPLGRIHLQLGPGIWALYGLNGAGKTRALDAIRATLRGQAVDGGRGVVHVQIDDTAASPGADFVAALAEGVWLGAMREEALFADQNVAADLRATLEQVVDRHLSSVDYEWESADLLIAEAAESGYFSLQATGIGEPQWRIWISDCPRPGSPLADALAAAEPIVRARRELHHRALEDGPNMTHVDEMVRLSTAMQAVSPWYDTDQPGLLDLNRDVPSSRPPWVPVELTGVGNTAIAPLAVVDVGAPPTDVDGQTLADLASQEGGLFTGGDSVSLSDEVGARICELEEAASEYLCSMLGPAFRLRLELRSPRDWFMGSTARWVCDDEYSTAVPISSLSAACGRWAAAAIGLALAGGESQDQPSVVLADEPEAGVHRSAESQVVAGLNQLTAGPARAGLVATHSPAFLSDARVQPLHVRRSLYGTTEVVVLPGLPADDDLGFTKADLLALRRVFVIVEGEHDKIVLSTLFPDELEQAFAKVLVLRGASRVITAAHAEWLIEATDAPLLIVLDKLDAQTVDDWNEARAHAVAGRFEEALSVVERLRAVKKDEAGFLSRLGVEAIRTGVFGRLHFLGLQRDDVLDYLPDGPRLRSLKRNLTLTNAEVEGAVRSMDAIHPDLTTLVAEITRLSRCRGPAMLRPIIGRRIATG